MNNPNPKVNNLCAIYLRISIDRNMDGLAIDRQRDECKRIVKDRHWKVWKEYVDQSKSATNKAKHRPAYDQMVADYKAGHFTNIVCYDLDRLTRQPRQLEDWIDAAQEGKLVLVTANGEADLSTDVRTCQSRRRSRRSRTQRRKTEPRTQTTRTTRTTTSRR